jgi:hypothetical protein
MEHTDLSRRRALQLSSVAGVAALAGCTGILDDGGDGGSDGDVPGYATYLAPGADDATLVVFLDIEGLRGIEDDFEDVDANATEEPEDPLLSLPANGLLILAFAQFSLSATGLDALVDTAGGGNGQNESEDGQGSGREFETEISQQLLANEATVLVGDIDTAEIEEVLGTTPEDALFQQAFERVDAVGDYDIYQPVGTSGGGDGSDGDGGTGGGNGDGGTGGGNGDGGTGGGNGDGVQTVGVSSEEILSGSSREQVERVVEAVGGDRERSFERFDEFEQLLETAGDGQLVFGGHGPEGFGDAVEESESNNESDPTPDPGGTGPGNESDPSADLGEVGTANAIVSSLNFDSDSIEAELAASFDEDVPEDVQSEIEAEFGTEAADLSTEFDGNRVTLRASYDPESL